MMLALLFTPHDFDRALRRRRLAALGLMALGALGCLCYSLLPWDGGILPDYARGFYLGASCGIALAGVALLFAPSICSPTLRRESRLKSKSRMSGNGPSSSSPSIWRDLSPSTYAPPPCW